jgi:hypothetical protein
MIEAHEAFSPPRGDAPEPAEPAPPAAGAPGPDLFALGRAALARSRALHGGRGLFARTKQLLATGVWRGPRDAAEACVEEEDLAALGGLEAARALGARTLVAAGRDEAASQALVAAAAAHGLRCLWRLPFRADEPAAARETRLAALAAAARAGLPIDGVLPTPAGEPLGLDTLLLFARSRLALPVPHLLADFARLGHRLAQMALGFGADELHGPIHPERALRLGANAGNPVMTRKEAAILLRGAGLVPHERLGGGRLEEVAP